MALVGGPQLGRHLVEPARLAGAQQRAVDHAPLGQPAQGPCEDQPAVGLGLAVPAAFDVARQRVEPPGDVARRLLGALGVVDDVRVEGAGDERLLAGGHVRHPAHQGLHQVLGLDRPLDQGGQIGAGDLVAVGKREHGVLDPVLDQVGIELAVVLQIAQRFAALGAIERWLGDEQVAALDDLGHLA